MSEKKKVLVFADWYEPGYKAGGPIRSCVNFTQHLKQDHEIYVFTSDRDLGSEAPYAGIQADTWLQPEASVHLFYASPKNRGPATIREQLARIAPDYVYLNSMFSLHFALLPLWLARRKAGGPQIVLSPRGMLRESALRFKPLKKKVFLQAFRRLGFAEGIHFLASDEEEQRDLRLHFGPTTTSSVISNLPAVLVDDPVTIKKEPGHLSMIFVGRIHPIKNPDYLLQVLADLPGSADRPPMVKLTIVGSLEDKACWQKCRQIIAALPANIEVTYRGEIPNEQISGLIKEHHVFVLPTQGENFGHAIFEALSSKRPVLISDQTPWRHLQEAKAGWDLPLQEPAAFGRAIQEALAWDQAGFDARSEGALALARAHRDNSGALEKYRRLFS